MQTTTNSLFTPTEAAVLTHLSVKAVNNAIDKQTILSINGERAGYTTRLLDFRAHLSLMLERRLANRLVPEFRRELFEKLARAKRNTISLDGGFMKIDLREPRQALAASLRELRQVRQLILTDPEIMGGIPVFRGTRMPVQLIAELIEQNSAEEDLLAAYPRLTRKMLRAAPLYMTAYPLRGRPRTQFWHDRPPVTRIRRKLA